MTQHLQYYTLLTIITILAILTLLTILTILTILTVITVSTLFTNKRYYFPIITYRGHIWLQSSPISTNTTHRTQRGQQVQLFFPRRAGVFHKGVELIELIYSGVLFNLVHFFLKAFRVLLSFAICLSISIELRIFFVYICNLGRVFLSLQVCM